MHSTLLVVDIVKERNSCQYYAAINIKTNWGIDWFSEAFSFWTSVNFLKQYGGRQVRLLGSGKGRHNQIDRQRRKCEQEGNGNNKRALRVISSVVKREKRKDVASVAARWSGGWLLDGVQYSCGKKFGYILDCLLYTRDNCLLKVTRAGLDLI